MNKNDLSETHLRIQKSITDVFDGTPSITRHADETIRRQITLATVTDSPAEGVISYASIGLSDYPAGMIGSLALGVELVGACRNEFTRFPDILSLCVSKIISGQTRYHPGAVIKEVISGFFPDLAMKHILLVTPYGWSKDLLTLEFPDRWVSWLMALPISDAELKFYNTTESGGLQERLVKTGADIYDLTRASII